MVIKPWGEKKKYKPKTLEISCDFYFVHEFSVSGVRSPPRRRRADDLTHGRDVVVGQGFEPEAFELVATFLLAEIVHLALQIAAEDVDLRVQLDLV